MNDLNNPALFSQIQNIFHQAMGNDVEIHPDTRREMVAEWDSINHLNLIVELESKFNLGLSMDEIEKIDSVNKILELVQSRKN